jgi:DNA gyrase/topoisomerase IV subunit B
MPLAVNARWLLDSVKEIDEADTKFDEPTGDKAEPRREFTAERALTASADAQSHAYLLAARVLK